MWSKLSAKPKDKRHDAPAVDLPPDLDHYLPPDLLEGLRATPLQRRDWLNATNHLRSIRYLIATYLPGHLAEKKKHDPRAGLVEAEVLEGSLLFSDVSGFTALSERLANRGQEGTEQLTHAINRYFDAMLDILARSGGTLLKFAGDALLAYFPAYREGQQAQWAVRAAQRMMLAMQDFTAIPTPLGALALKMKVGISTGPFAAFSVGSAQRMEYVILGDAVARTMAAEGAAVAGEIVVDANTAALLPTPGEATSLEGYSRVPPAPDEDRDDFEIRAPRGRSRTSQILIFDPAEMVKELGNLLRQIQALSPYLSPELVERIIAEFQHRRIESEYRPTTVLFTNTRGFEDLIAGEHIRDPERLAQARDALNAYFNAIHAAIRRYGGVITRIDPYSHGSKVLVLFGAPIAHEDDPERCLHAALEMQARLAALNEQWRRGRALAGVPPVQQRLGVTQGLTFAGQAGTAKRREYTVMGDDVNLAARLMSSAEPGQILIAPNVYDDAVGTFRLTQLPAIRVKGKSQPIPIYQVEGLRGDNRLLRRIESQGPLVGRQPLRAQGRAALDSALAGTGSVLVLEGSAGIGKSRLADALAGEAIRRGARGWLLACKAYDAHTPYAPWIAWLRALAHIPPDESPQRSAEKLRHFLARLQIDQESAIAPLYPLLGLPVPPTLIHPIQKPAPAKPAPQRPGMFASLSQRVAAPQDAGSGANLWQVAQARQTERASGPPTPAGEPQSQGGLWQQLQQRVEAKAQARNFAAVARLLERLTEDSPVVLILEDAHWIDALSRATLAHVAERVAAWPVLMLVTQRERRPPDGLGEGTGFPKLTLGPLSQEETRHLAQSLLGGPPLSRRMGDIIYRHSGGNPLFVEEIVRWLQRQSQDARQPEARELRKGLHASSTLQELVLSRVDSLPHQQRTVVKHAAILGDDFTSEDLRPLLEGINDSQALKPTLHSLDEARMTYPVDEVGAHHAFQQTLIREFVYNSQPFATRRKLHRQIAQIMEERHAHHPLPYAEVLAYHYERATCWLPAARYLLLSARKAQQRGAFPQAGHACRRALKALAELPASDAQVKHLKAVAHEGCGDSAMSTKRFAEAAEAYAAACQLVDAGPPSIVQDGGATGFALSAARLRSKLALALAGQEPDALPRATATAQQAWEAAELPLDRVLAAAMLAWLRWRAGETDAAPWRERAEHLASQGQATIEEAAPGGPVEAWMRGVQGLLHELAGKWRAAREIYLALGDPANAARASAHEGERALSEGQTALAVAWLAQAAELWEQADDEAGLALAHLRLAEAHQRAGDLSQAQAALAQAQEMLGADDPAYRAASDALAAGSTWPTAHWQLYETHCHLLLLFRL